MIIFNFFKLEVDNTFITYVYKNLRFDIRNQTPHVVPRELEMMSLITICSTGNVESPLSPIIKDFEPS